MSVHKFTQLLVVVLFHLLAVCAVAPSGMNYPIVKKETHHEPNGENPGKVHLGREGGVSSRKQDLQMAEQPNIEIVEEANQYEEKPRAVEVPPVKIV